MNISFTRYYEAIKQLKSLYYICDDGNNHLQFFVRPNPEYAKTHGIKDWENPETEIGLPKMENLSPKTEIEIPKTDEIKPKTVSISPKTDIEIDNKYIDNEIKNTDIPLADLSSLARDLEAILFNHCASDEDWDTLSQLIDVDAYSKADRQFFRECNRDEKVYQKNIVFYVYELVKKMSKSDIEILQNIVKRCENLLYFGGIANE